MKDKVNVLIVCGYGVGSSAMTESILAKALKSRNIQAELDHTSAGEAKGFSNWVDIVAVNKKLISIVDVDAFPGKHIIEVENIMDGKKMGDQVEEVVRQYFPDAIKE